MCIPLEVECFHFPWVDRSDPCGFGCLSCRCLMWTGSKCMSNWILLDIESSRQNRKVKYLCAMEKDHSSHLIQLNSSTYWALLQHVVASTSAVVTKTNDHPTWVEITIKRHHNSSQISWIVPSSSVIKCRHQGICRVLKLGKEHKMFHWE